MELEEIKKKYKVENENENETKESYEFPIPTPTQIHPSEVKPLRRPSFSGVVAVDQSNPAQMKIRKSDTPRTPKDTHSGTHTPKHKLHIKTVSENKIQEVDNENDDTPLPSISTNEEKHFEPPHSSISDTHIQALVERNMYLEQHVYELEAKLNTLFQTYNSDDEIEQYEQQYEQQNEHDNSRSVFASPTSPFHFPSARFSPNTSELREKFGVPKLNIENVELEDVDQDQEQQPEQEEQFTESESENESLEYEQTVAIHGRKHTRVNTVLDGYFESSHRDHDHDSAPDRQPTPNVDTKTSSRKQIQHQQQYD
jgi:hypothetical protein